MGARRNANWGNGVGTTFILHAMETWERGSRGKIPVARRLGMENRSCQVSAPVPLSGGQSRNKKKSNGRMPDQKGTEKTACTFNFESRKREGDTSIYEAGVTRRLRNAAFTEGTAVEGTRKRG